MRELSAGAVTEAVARLCIRANTHLTEDVTQAIAAAREAEDWPAAREILDRILENDAIGGGTPICQDTGMACVFLEVGQDVHITGDLRAAVDEGVRRGYADGYLRKSVVADPLDRVNTGDNTPAMLHVELVPGDRIKITVAPKGFGSENMTRLKMFNPSVTQSQVEDFIVDCVSQAGSNPCPPVVVGVGLGGTSEMAALLAKRALLRPAGEGSPDPFYREMEGRLLERINALGIGPQGMGGRTTALSVAILTCGTHIAGLPCAVNLGCHVTRHAHTQL